MTTSNHTVEPCAGGDNGEFRHPASNGPFIPTHIKSEGYDMHIDLNEDECYCLAQHLTAMFMGQLLSEPSMEEWVGVWQQDWALMIDRIKRFWSSHCGKANMKMRLDFTESEIEGLQLFPIDIPNATQGWIKDEYDHVWPVSNPMRNVAMMLTNKLHVMKGDQREEG